MQRLLPLAVVILLCSCSHQTANSPAAPSDIPTASSIVNAPAVAESVAGDTALLIDPTTGERKGHVVIAPDARTPNGEFHAEVTVDIRGLEPNTTYQVWRAIDFVPDGTYDPAAAGLPFVEIATITTSSGGAGTAHFVRGGGLFSGDRFDVLIEVRLDDGVTVVLRSEVLTITVK